MKNQTLRFILGVCLTLVLVGILAYLQMAFQKADVKAAVRLVEEVQIDGKPLLWSIDNAISKHQRVCEVSIVNKFYGHAEVVCYDSSERNRELRWLVNVVDGMVKPSNEAAIRLGKKETPWLP